MFKLTLVALALCLAVAFAEFDAEGIFDVGVEPLAFDSVAEEMVDMDTEEHKLKAYMGPKYAKMPKYGTPSYGIPSYGMPSYAIPSYGLPTIPNYGYASYPSYGYKYGYPLPMKKAFLGHKMKHHF